MIGNGPQIGHLAAVFELANRHNPIQYYAVPFDVYSSYTQGYIGYHLQNAIGQELKKQGINKNVISIITQVEVDQSDEAFSNPTKPIGIFYNKSEAENLALTHNYTMKEDSGRGWRRCVSSPLPLDIVEKYIILELYKNGSIVIACGGGGIPVVRTPYELYKGIEAVIDKDLSAAKLAELLDADILLILTTVEKVSLHFNKTNQQEISFMSVKQAKQYMNEGHFAVGSMYPKIQAAINLIKSKPACEILITSIDKASDALKRLTGTLIKKA